MIKVGIIGGAGYTAGELIRLLLNHPDAEIVFVNSSSNAGNKITDVHEGLYGETDLRFTSELYTEVHGKPHRPGTGQNHRPQHGLSVGERRTRFRLWTA